MLKNAKYFEKLNPIHLRVGACNELMLFWALAQQLQRGDNHLTCLVKISSLKLLWDPDITVISTAEKLISKFNSPFNEVFKS